MDSEKQVNERDRYQARAQIIAAIIGALVAGLLGGREWKERSSDRDLAAKDESVKQLQSQLAESNNIISQLKSRVDAQEQEIEKLRSPSPGESPAPQPPLPIVVAAQEEHGVQFELRGCHLSGTEITCSLLVTNKAENDQRVSICARCVTVVSRIVDAYGDELLGSTASPGSGGSLEDSVVLASGIPIKASITFAGVRSARSLKLLEIAFKIWSHTIDSYQVKFQDIPLT